MERPHPLIIAGIFVGGRASRMGGIAKGRLLAPDQGEEIIVRSTRVLLAGGVSSCVLVGRETDREERTDMRALDDDPSATGPLAGLLALLAHAHLERASQAVAVACDMPFITSDLVRRLLDQNPTAAILAPRDHEGRWQPFFARYDAAVVLPIARTFASEGGRKLQHLFTLANAQPLELTDEEAKATLKDWDAPEDLPPLPPSEK